MKPILFNTDMVRAILDNRKTVTRRKPFRMPENLSPRDGFYRDAVNRLCVLFERTEDRRMVEYVVAPYAIGDILYVRETWNTLVGDFIYKADQKPWFKNSGKWRPSIHMPREAARIFLRVKNIRVERLQDITEADLARDFDFCPEAIKAVGRDALAKPFWDSTIKSAGRALYGWDANPWVWVIEFERISREEAYHGMDTP